MKEEPNLDNQTFALPGVVKESNSTAESVRSIISSTGNFSSIKFNANTVALIQSEESFRTTPVLHLHRLYIHHYSKLK